MSYVVGRCGAARSLAGFRSVQAGVRSCGYIGGAKRIREAGEQAGMRGKVGRGIRRIHGYRRWIDLSMPSVPGESLGASLPVCDTMFSQGHWSRDPAERFIWELWRWEKKPWKHVIVLSNWFSSIIAKLKKADPLP